MSWSGFKKATQRATTQVMMKTGHVEKTSDREYEVEERRYRTLESASLRLQKEAKGYLDSLRAMTASQMRIAETIDAFYGDSGARDGVSRSYKQAVEDLDAETIKALDGPYRYVRSAPDCLTYDKKSGVYDCATLVEIQALLKFGGSRGGHFACSFQCLSNGEATFEIAAELIDRVYRTTVLEPINRFCAYFPDINECIKKRNHKLLDYDAMRSKVKKLVEKPDKDPSKLPRTEKETEMVSTTSNLSNEIESNEYINSDDDFELNEALRMPSPPKVLERIGRGEHARAENDYVSGYPPQHLGLVRSPSATSLASNRVSGLTPQAPGSSASFNRSPTPSFKQQSERLSGLRKAPLDTPSHRRVSSPKRNRPGRILLAPVNDRGQSQNVVSHISRSLRRRHSKHVRRSINSPCGTSSERNSARTPFFHPSELEDLMQPLREEYIRTQTNLCMQAKAAYEQLNQQLTDELPQLIDLRVPYLDPSFEALVKIQLRFCAEAYSRMAQVQQYLDASTRDQYASGDLDARVEDVLGQIRDLSIAGTV